MTKKSERQFLYWTPRVLLSVIIVFFFLMSLDVLGLSVDSKQIFLRFLIHNIPTLILTFALKISDKFEWLSALICFLFGIVYIVGINLAEIDLFFVVLWSIFISGPFLFSSILFFVDWKKR